MKLVPITKGKFAMVDDEDFDRVMQHKWQYQEYGYAIGRRSLRNGTKTRTTVFMHRFILDPPKGIPVDHIDGDKLNNQKSNLRLCRSRDNIRNRPKNRGVYASEFKGVTWKYGKWYARITVDTNLLGLGCFEREADAAIAYNQAALIHHGQFARLNNINGMGERVDW